MVEASPDTCTLGQTRPVGDVSLSLQANKGSCAHCSRLGPVDHCRDRGGGAAQNITLANTSSNREDALQ